MAARRSAEGAEGTESLPVPAERVASDPPQPVPSSTAATRAPDMRPMLSVMGLRGMAALVEGIPAAARTRKGEGQLASSAATRFRGRTKVRTTYIHGTAMIGSGIHMNTWAISSAGDPASVPARHNG